MSAVAQRACTAVVSCALALLALAGCQTGRADVPTEPGSDPAGVGIADACAGTAPTVETLTDPGFGDGEPPQEAMDWQFAAEELAQQVTTLAGDRFAALWLVWVPERAVAVRITEGPELPELQAAAEAAGVTLDVRYDATHSEAELIAASEALSARLPQVPGLMGASVDGMNGRLLFSVASGDDGGAAPCAAIAAVLADIGVPYAFDVVQAPVDSTVRGPVAFSVLALTDDRTLQISVPSCNGEPEVTSLEQTDTEVRLELTATQPAPGWGGDGCLDILDVTLDAPLAGRTLIDITTGDVVDVTG